ncbi:MAG: hypothetical protein ACYTFT_11720, partial [Planctomycetota bacterium]
AAITIEGSGPKTTFKAEGIAEGVGDTFKNPVTGVGLIRFRGHFPKGGYDVHDGDHEAVPAPAPAV